MFISDGGAGMPRQIKWLGNILRHPIDFLRVLKPWGKAETGTVVMAMQTADNHTRLVRKRQLLWPFSRTLTSQPDPGQPGTRRIVSERSFGCPCGVTDRGRRSCHIARYFGRPASRPHGWRQRQRSSGY